MRLRGAHVDAFRGEIYSQADKPIVPFPSGGQAGGRARDAAKLQRYAKREINLKICEGPPNAPLAGEKLLTAIRAVYARAEPC